MTKITKGKILVVDDDRLVLATVAHGLTQAGYEVIDADNGDEAILLARQHNPDLALLDIRMEGKTGFDVAQYLREYGPIPFIFLSAFADEATLKQVHDLGALTYLTKPLDIQQIILEVDAAFLALAKQNLEKPNNVLKTDFSNTTPSPASPPPNEENLQANLASQSPTVLLAVGIVMHRFSLTKEQALARLQLQLQSQLQTSASSDNLHSVCQRVVDAQEVLAGLG